MKPPTVLIIHNFYRHKGGEDTVVMHETAALKQAGAKVYELYFHNPQGGAAPLRMIRFLSGIFFNIQAYWQVFRMVRQRKVDVVHVHNSFYQASPSVLWAARHAGARVVVTLHNFRLFCLNALFYRGEGQCTRCVDERSFAAGVQNGCFRDSKVQSLFLASSLQLHRWLGSWTKAVDQFIIINPAMRTYLEGIGVMHDKIHLKPNCIADRPYRSYASRRGHYLAASRLEATKGIPTLLEAWERVDLPLQIAGAGTMQPQVEALANTNIRYLGLLDEAGMQQALGECKAFLFTSRLMEGMPLTIIEAMAAGTICIAHSSPVTRMLIEDGVTGLLYDGSGGAAALHDAVLRLEAMPSEQLHALSEAARRSYVRRFSLHEHMRHIAHVYRLPLHLPEPDRQKIPQAVAV